MSFRSILNQLVGRRFGKSIQPYPPLRTLESEIMLLLRTTGATGIIDIGAHEGGFARKLRRAGFAGSIVSYEPFPESFAKLARAAATDPNWHVHQLALGSAAGSAELHVFNSGGGQFNSLRSASPHAEVYAPGLEPSGVVPVSVCRLTDVWPAAITPPAETLVKIDTQGHDVDVLIGAADILDVIPAVVMEVAVRPLYEGVAPIHEVLAQMDRWGFELTGTFPVHRYGLGARVIEFDCTFVKSDRA